MEQEVTFYIDESGSFLTSGYGTPSEPPWVVGGYYVVGERKEQESILLEKVREALFEFRSTKVFSDVAKIAIKELEFGKNLTEQTSREDFYNVLKPILNHLNNLGTSNSPIHRSDIVKALLHLGLSSTLDSFMDGVNSTVFNAFKDTHFLIGPVVAVNTSNTVGPDNSNYAILLHECIATVCSFFASSGKIAKDTRLHFEIARRKSVNAKSVDPTMQGQDIDEFREHLRRRIASGLVSFGAEQLLGTVDIGDARISPYLGIADLICGNARERLKHNYQVGLDSLDKLGYIVSFLDQSTSSKRAAFALLEGDWSSTFVLLLKEVKEMISTRELDARAKEITRVTLQLLTVERPRSVHAVFDATIERLDQWSRLIPERTFATILATLDRAVLHALESLDESEPQRGTLYAVLFKLQTRQLALANRLGDSDLARQLATRLSDSKMHVQNDIELIDAFFKHEIGLVEKAINDHRFEDAAAIAADHSAFVRASTIFPSQSGTADRSRAELRANSLELRALVLAEANRMQPDMATLRSMCDEELGRFPELENPLFLDDQLRIIQIQSFCSEVMADCDSLRASAMSLQTILSNRADSLPYGLATLIRIAASESLISGGATKTLINNECRLAALRMLLSPVLVHPTEVAMREWLLFCFLNDSFQGNERVSSTDMLQAWAKQVTPKSAVLMHQLEVLELVLSYISGSALNIQLLDSEAARAINYQANGIGKRESYLLAKRTTTIY